ncbi:TPA: hypothetical protein DCZ36_03225 [Candidatus Gracilibacteria bacterium]|nr:hypothetical protein [Candidatus Gracilibacteria bacterium]
MRTSHSNPPFLALRTSRTVRSGNHARGSYGFDFHMNFIIFQEIPSFVENKQYYKGLSIFLFLGRFML